MDVAEIVESALDGDEGCAVGADRGEELALGDAVGADAVEVVFDEEEDCVAGEVARGGAAGHGGRIRGRGLGDQAGDAKHSQAHHRDLRDLATPLRCNARWRALAAATS